MSNPAKVTRATRAARAARANGANGANGSNGANGESQPAADLSRRRMLRNAAVLAGTLAPPWSRLSWAAGPPGDERKLVVVLLRGGLDGLAAVPAPGDPDFAAARGVLGEYAQPLLPLAGPFALHPALARLHKLYGAGEAAVVHAVGLPYRERSHFDAQQLLESGGRRPYELASGWLGRALQAAGRRGVALSTAVPLLLRGADRIDSWSPSTRPDPAPDLVQRLAQLYQRDSELAHALERARRLHEEPALPSMAAMADGGGGRGRLVPLAHKAAELMSRPGGASVAVLEAGGWDTHANQAPQGNTQGALAGNLRQLDQALGALRDALAAPADGAPAGAAAPWSRTVVLVTSEFGREVAVNGTNGSDHGSGGVAFVLGGAVHGGRVIADWPGLAPSQRHEGRDLRITTDLRALLRPLLRRQLGLGESLLDREVLPGSAGLDEVQVLRA